MVAEETAVASGVSGKSCCAEEIAILVEHYVALGISATLFADRTTRMVF